jgi:demethylmenaquinone methyltransferase/2-methoxy-6-polyprenyl-1,4-benzoquinol methylase
MEPKEEKVYRIFQDIAQNYDRANDWISLGQHRRWKRTLVDTVARFTKGHGAVLDLCCGTGDVALSLAGEQPGLLMVGMDFSPSMLKVAEQKREKMGLGNVQWVNGSAMALPFPNDAFDCSVISFGLRNTTDYKKVLSEMMRVTKPGGVICCLEASWPDARWVHPFFQIYFKYIMPLLGGGRSKKPEYQWLHDSTKQFLSKREVLDLFQDTGLEQVSYRSFLFGTCALHTGFKHSSRRHYDAQQDSGGKS